MRNKTFVPVATFKALFKELFTWGLIYSLLRQCGLRRRCPPYVTSVELIQSMVFHTVAEAGTLAQHVKQLTGKTITDGALAQRRALMPAAVFEELMAAALKPKADPICHPDAFYHGLRLCGADGRRSPKWAQPSWWNWACTIHWPPPWGPRENRR
jgi:hypothetical protein